MTRCKLSQIFKILVLKILFFCRKAKCFKYKAQVTQGAEYYEAAGHSILAYSEAQLVAARFPHCFVHPEFLKISIAIAWTYHDIFHNTMAAIYFARATSSRAATYLENREPPFRQSLYYMRELDRLINKWEEELGVEGIVIPEFKVIFILTVSIASDDATVVGGV